MPQMLCPVVVGRDAELDLLRQALADARAGRGAGALLVGPPGIGKSRLAQEAARWAHAEGLAVGVGRARPTAATSAYRPLTEALLALLRGGDVPQRPGLERWLPLLQPLLPNLVDQPTPAPEADVAPSLRAEAVLQLLTAVGSDALVLVLEDLHWADPDTVEAVEYLGDNLSGSRLFLVATLRDSPDSAALAVARRQRNRPRLSYLTLERLVDEELDEMVRACRPDASEELVAQVREASEGVPLLVEDLLASPGLPDTFSATVRARLGELGPSRRQVIEAAAVLGRDFDWELLGVMTGQDEATVADSLAAGTDSLLLSSRDGVLRFRHALTREAVLDTLLPPHQRRLARAALAQLETGDPAADEARRGLAIDLAQRAGERVRAGILLAESGRRSLGWGALATAVETLRRSAALLEGAPEQGRAELDLVEALALAGRVEEAAAVGGRLVSRLGLDPDTAALRCEAHVRLAEAAVAAARWAMARHHSGLAAGLAGSLVRADLAGRIAVLEAELSLAGDDHDRAQAQAEAVLGTEGIGPDVRCHAWEIVGRIRRSSDLPGGRAAFEQALVTAEAADLTHWQLRALHELGTIELFDHVGLDRLLEARRRAEEMGALGTAAVLDLQLGAGYTARWDLERCDAHCQSAAATAERLGLDRVRAKSLALLAGTASMRADVEGTERWAAASLEADPTDPMLEGFRLQSVGFALLLGGEEKAALEPWGKGVAALNRVPHGEPISVRALWPLILAARADRRARSAIDDARRLGVAAFGLNAGQLLYAGAVLAGRDGDTRRADALASEAVALFPNSAAWAELARTVAAPAAMADGWGQSDRWVGEASAGFESRGLPAMVARAQALMRAARPNPWAGAGISHREADVLRLVAEGLANKEIAARLGLSVRTVEKHVESLLRKAAVRSRTELVARLPAPPAST